MTRGFRKLLIKTVLKLVVVIKPFGVEGLFCVSRADKICVIFGTRRIVCKFWFCTALVAVVVKFCRDVLPNILSSTHRQ